MAMRTKTTASTHSRYRARQPSNFALADVLADFAAAYRLLDSGQLANHVGQMVAVLRGEVVGAGPDGVSLRARISKSRRVSPERIAIIRVFDETTVYG